MSTLPSSSVLVRTWFGDDAAWHALVQAVQTPNDDGFLAGVSIVNDPAFEGLSAEELRTKQADDEAEVSFLADEKTLTSAEYPILAVRLMPPDDDDSAHSRQFRVIPSSLWCVGTTSTSRT